MVDSEIITKTRNKKKRFLNTSFRQSLSVRDVKKTSQKHPCVSISLIINGIPITSGTRHFN